MAALRESLERQGAWLFKWRSYLPLVGLPLVVVALTNSGCIERAFGKTANNFWDFFSLCLSFLGLGVRFLTAGYVPRGTSGRNSNWQAAEMLNTTGMYSVVRNPLYLGNFIIVFGVILFLGVWWLALIMLVGFWIYHERIIFTEEEFLRKKFEDLFLAWAQNTPAFFPRVKNWKKPALSFSLKTAIRREFSTFFAVIATFTFLGIAKGLLSEGKFKISLPWAILFVAGLIIYHTLLFLKKKTKILNVPGR